ncbi:MAG: XdhC family protein [Paracoccaceae bacterium]|nr:XdhC family protein [Paracoccaceae bacterium]
MTHTHAPQPATHHDQIPEIALEWHLSGVGAVLASVVETWGSAPRPVGSLLAISGKGEIMGSVSGGCVEGAVVAEALEALADGQPRLLSFGVSNDDAFAVGLACGGTIRILVEPVGAAMPLALLRDLVTARAGRKPIAYVANLDGLDRWLTDGSGASALDISVQDRMRADRSGLEGAHFIAVHNPPLRLAIVGAVHIAQPLCQIARLTGYDPVVIDPRGAFGAQTRFPGETILEDWPDEALLAHGLDTRTAVVTLTHDPKLDDPALHVALRSDIFYLGALGSRKTHAARVERLQAAGFSDDQIARIHAPVGLNIGAKSPAEIALSIMADITTSLRQPQ